MRQSTIQEEEVVADLLNIKAKLEQSLTSINEEKENLRSKISLIKDQKAEIRKKKTEIFQKLYQNKILLVDANKRVENYSTHVENVNKIMKDLEGRICNQMQLSEFEQKVMALKTNIQSAINFYNEDCLQMELMKKTNAVRERRVEYTKVESECNEMERKIEAHKRELERAKMIELEKARQEEELAKKLEEERIQAEESKRREEFIRQRSSSRSELAPITPELPFLNSLQLTSDGANNESFEAPQSDDGLSMASPDKTNTDAIQGLPRARSLSGFNTFSQLLKW